MISQGAYYEQLKHLLPSPRGVCFSSALASSALEKFKIKARALQRRIPTDFISGFFGRRISICMYNQVRFSSLLGISMNELC
jgi:hypothetical protein